MINIKSFKHVHGNGILDDTDGILSALNQCKGKELFLPEGVYLTKKTLPWFNCSRIIGAGIAPADSNYNNIRGTTLRATHPIPAILQSETWLNDGWLHFAQIENLTLDANRNASHCLQIHNPGEACSLRNVHIRNALKDNLWGTGSAASFTAHSLINHLAGRYALAFSNHPTFKAASGLWKFHDLSCDNPHDALVFLNCSQIIELWSPKLECIQSVSPSYLSNRMLYVSTLPLDSIPPSTTGPSGLALIRLHGGSINAGGNPDLHTIFHCDPNHFSEFLWDHPRITGCHHTHTLVNDQRSSTLIPLSSNHQILARYSHTPHRSLSLPS